MWIYRLDFHEAMILGALFVGLFYVAKEKFSRYRIWRFAVVLALAAWGAVVVFQTISHRTPDPSLQPIWQPFQSYVDALKEGGQKELLRSNFMNAALFYPAGVLLVSLLPEKWYFYLRLLVVLILFTAVSLSIELAQCHYFLGIAQTDDVMHNALGACFGAVTFLFISKVIKQMRNRGGETV